MGARPAYLLIIEITSSLTLEMVDQAGSLPGMSRLRPVLLTTDPTAYASLRHSSPSLEIVGCSFASDAEIREALRPYKMDIRAVICRGEKSISLFRKVIPHLPAGTLTATPRALKISTNKRLMREAFLRYAPEITPPFVRAGNAPADTIHEVEATLEYPVVVKPAGLASSMLIQACDNRRELRTALTKTSSLIREVYTRHGQRAAPEIIIENYLAGDCYSIDAYILGPGECYVCPPVGYVPANQLGIRDFFLYKRFIPAKLSSRQTAAANRTVAKALAAVGLTYSSAHVELVLTAQGWKIIELGPRLGRFRHMMYKEAYGINHSLNDILIHLGKKPVIPKKLRGYCSAYSIYSEKEGALHAIQGLEKVANDPLTHQLRILARPGDQCRYAKHGGSALAEIFIAGTDFAAFQATASYIEHNVKAIIR